MVNKYDDQLRSSISSINFDGVVHAIEQGADVNGYHEINGCKYYTFYEVCNRYPTYNNYQDAELLRILKYLISKGADVNSIGCARRQTPLHIAASVGWLDGVVVLLDSGANKEITDIYGLTAESHAESLGYQNIEYYGIPEYIRSYEFPVKGVNS